jgi:hypothetical protein
MNVNLIKAQNKLKLRQQTVMVMKRTEKMMKAEKIQKTMPVVMVMVNYQNYLQGSKRY